MSVIIAVYKRADWLSICLAALQQQRVLFPWELIIVDDGSPNQREIYQTVTGWRPPDMCSFQLLRKKNGGPAAARNFGVAKTCGDILCFLDDDSVPTADWLQRIHGHFERDDSIALVSGKTLSYERNKTLPLLLEKSIYTGKCWATCNIAYRKSMFQALGGFDESFPEPSWEDNDLGLRARWAGYRHEHKMDVVVYHPHEETLSEYRRKCLQNGRGAAIFSVKHMRTKPLWSLLTPVLVGRRLVYGLFPVAWLKMGTSVASVKFLWAYYSLCGFMSMLTESYDAKN